MNDHKAAEATARRSIEAMGHALAKGTMTTADHALRHAVWVGEEEDGALVARFRFENDAPEGPGADPRTKPGHGRNTVVELTMTVDTHVDLRVGETDGGQGIRAPLGFEQQEVVNRYMSKAAFWLMGVGSGAFLRPTDGTGAERRAGTRTDQLRETLAKASREAEELAGIAETQGFDWESDVPPKSAEVFQQAMRQIRLTDAMITHLLSGGAHAKERSGPAGTKPTAKNGEPETENHAGRDPNDAGRPQGMCGLPSKLVVAGGVKICGNPAYRESCADCGLQACWIHLRAPCPAGTDLPFGRLQHITPGMQQITNDPELLQAMDVRISRFAGQGRPAMLALLLRSEDHPEGRPPVHCYADRLTNEAPRETATPDAELNQWLRRWGLPTPVTWYTGRELVQAVRDKLGITDHGTRS